MNAKSLQIKITWWTGVCIVITAGAIIAYSYISARERADSTLDSISDIAASVAGFMEEKAMGSAKDQMITKAKLKVFQTRAEFKKSMGMVRTLAQTLSGMKSAGVIVDIGRNSVNSILRTLLENNNKIIGVYTCWEPDSFDMLDIAYAGAKKHDKTGRFIPFIDARGTDGEN